MTTENPRLAAVADSYQRHRDHELERLALNLRIIRTVATIAIATAPVRPR